MILNFVSQFHSSLFGSAIPLFCITRAARWHDIFFRIPAALRDRYNVFLDKLALYFKPRFATIGASKPVFSQDRFPFGLSECGGERSLSSAPSLKCSPSFLSILFVPASFIFSNFVGVVVLPFIVGCTAIFSVCSIKTIVDISDCFRVFFSEAIYLLFDFIGIVFSPQPEAFPIFIALCGRIGGHSLTPCSRGPLGMGVPRTAQNIPRIIPQEAAQRQ